jgi:hypothetical protein
MSQATSNRSFDELTKGLASGTLSRRRALRLMGAALVGGTMAYFPGAAWAAKGGGGGRSACAHYCQSLFPGDDAAQGRCTSQGTKGTGPCFACGGPENPGPTCGPNQGLHTRTCQCVPANLLFCTCRSDTGLSTLGGCFAIDCTSVEQWCADVCAQQGRMVDSFSCSANNSNCLTGGGD